MALPPSLEGAFHFTVIWPCCGPLSTEAVGADGVPTAITLAIHDR